MAITLGVMGLLSTTATIFLSTIPAGDEPHKMLTVLKVVGGATVMVASGAAVFALERSRAHRALELK